MLQLLAGEFGQDHQLQACGVTDPAAVEKFAAVVSKRFGAPPLRSNRAATDVVLCLIIILFLTVGVLETAGLVRK